MSVKFYFIAVFFLSGIFFSCENQHVKGDESENQTSEVAQDDSTSTLNTKEGNEAHSSVRLDDELSLLERFNTVIAQNGKSTVWVAADEDQSVFEFLKDNTFKGSFKKGTNTYEGRWKFEGEEFFIKTDNDEQWTKIPLTVVDRETIVMIDLEFKAE